VAKLSLALRGLELDGLETNRDLLQAVLDDGAFRRGDIDIHYLESRSDLRDATLADDVRFRHAAAAGFSLLEERAAASLVPVPAAGWRNVGRALHADELRDATGTIEVRVSAPDAPAELRVDGEWQAAGTATSRHGVVDHTASDGLRRRYRVRLGPHAAYVNGPEGQSTFARRAEDDATERGGVAGECRAPLPGAVTKVLVSVGDVVAEGDGLVVLEAMKMEHTLRALGAGTVRAVHGAAGQQVDVGDLLVEMEPS
jgi:acetyl/propionyl-CoA carboxylase alpha subunit